MLQPILRIVLPYAAFAALWIYTSDAIVARWVPDAEALTRFQTLKGLIFVLATAALLFVLLRREIGLRARVASDHAQARLRLADVLGSITDGFIHLDHAWRITYVNPRAAAMLGRPSEQLVGREIWDQCPELAGHAFAHALRRAMAERVPQTVDAYYPPANRWLEKRVSPTPDGIAVVVRDVTDRRRAEGELHDAEERFRATFEQAAVGLAHVSPSGQWLRTNRKLCEIVGYTADEIAALTFQDLTHPEDMDNDLAHKRRLFAGEIDMYALEKRYIRKDRSIVWVGLTVSLVRNQTGEAKYLIKVIEDISRRHEAEAALRRSEERFRRMAESTAAAIFIVQNERLRFVNPQASHLTGYARDELLAMDAWDIVHPDYRSVLQSRAARVSGSSVIPRTEVKLVRRDGAERWIDMSVAVIELDGAPALLGTAYDISERKTAEAELRRAREMLEQRVADRTRDLESANAALQTFTYMMTHDLRTPLRAMQGFARALLEDYAASLPAGGQDYTRRMVVAAERLDMLILDLLVYSKIERAAITLGAVKLPDAVAAALAALESEIRLRSASVRVEVDAWQVHAEPTILVQVIENLVSNAMKFTAPGTVPQVRLHTERRAGRARFNVIDNGIGIAPADHDRIFKPFERLHGVEAYAGSGIGLSIAQKAVERMGGALGVESELGRGSCFWIEVPLVDREANA